MSPWRSRLLGLAFFLSGFAALVYQVVWQRALFALFGVNVEAVTVVVTAFMAGLGLGSLLGGRLSERLPGLGSFAVIELLLAAIGATSLPFLAWVGDVSAGMGSLSIALMTIALIFVPTALMGATLPILVAHAAPRSGNTGHTVGTLYSVNTLGSAVAAAGTVLLLASLGQQRTTWVAAGVNVTVSALGYGLSRRSAT